VEELPNLASWKGTPFGARRTLLGTDALGGDVLAQMLWACRLSISIGLVSTGISVLIGVTIGSVMGYFGGWVDMILFRVVEIFMAVPVLFLLIVAAGVLPRDTYVMMAIIGLFSWTGAARFTRAEFLKLRKQEFVQAAQATGLPLRAILFRHMLPNGVTPVLVLDLTDLQATVAQGHAVRHADQLPISEHGTRALAAVIQNDVNTHGHQLGIEPIGRGFDVGETVRTDRAQHHGERRQGIRPDDAACIMVLLNGGRRQPRDANAIAAHFHELRFAVHVQKGGVHGLAVLGAQVKHMADLDTALDRQQPFAIRRRVARHHVAQICHEVGFRQVTTPIDARHVEIDLIGTANPVAHDGDFTVNHHPHRFFQVDQPKVARLAAKVLVDFIQRGKAEATFHAG
jgi:hypothetical protein